MDVMDETDVADWPDQPGGLRLLDQSLRCGICGGLFDTPLLISKCGHTCE